MIVSSFLTAHQHKIGHSVQRIHENARRYKLNIVLFVEIELLPSIILVVKTVIFDIWCGSKQTK